MTATYDTANPTNKDRVRLKIADTNVTLPMFEDEEIEMALIDEGEVLLAAASLCRSAAASTARKPASVSVPGATFTRSVQAWLELADKLEAQAQSGASADSSNWFTDDAAHYDAITGRASVDLDTPSTE